MSTSRWCRWSVLPLVALVAGCHTAPSDTAPSAPSAPTASLYERLGGIDAIVAVTDDFVNRLASDQRVMSNPRVAEVAKTLSIPALKFKLATQLAQATGGPWRYGGRDMRSVHANLGITEAEWNASVEDLRATLAQFRVPGREQGELIAIVASTHDDVVTRR